LGVVLCSWFIEFDDDPGALAFFGAIGVVNQEIQALILDSEPWS
jgi:hypothetical protein